MIKLTKVKISQPTLEKLKEYQNQIDILPNFKEKIEKAKNSFSSKNKKGNKTFDSIKKGLKKMCSGIQRCVYCEDSKGRQVEHIRPKNFYPELCFEWENYVFACDECNPIKSNKFAIFREDTGEFHEVNKNKNKKPPKGESVMINPRNDNPMDYCMLDLRDSFLFYIISAENTKEYVKADYTFNQILKLNQQRGEDLRVARKKAFQRYKERFFHYTEKKKSGANKKQLDAMIKGIKSEDHPTVWKEMKRYFLRGLLNISSKELKESLHLKELKELHNLFENSPEALDW